MKLLLFFLSLLLQKNKGIILSLFHTAILINPQTLCCSSVLEYITDKRGREMDSMVIRSGTYTTKIQRR